MPISRPYLSKELHIRLFRNDNPWRRQFRPIDDSGLIWPNPPGTTARMQVRQYDGAAGNPLLTADVNVPMWGLEAIIQRADFAALPPDVEVGEPTVFRYDLLINLPGIGENVVFYGNAIVMDGVTR